MARAASTAPMSAVSHPKSSRIRVTCALADSFWPQMNMVGLPSRQRGLTNCRLPTELKALTRSGGGKLLLQPLHQRFLQAGKESKDTVNWRHIRNGIGSVDDRLPRKVLRKPAARRTVAAAEPFTARTTTSAKAAVSLTPPRRLSGMLCFPFRKPCPGSRVPSIVSWPHARKPAPRACATPPRPQNADLHISLYRRLSEFLRLESLRRFSLRGD